MNRKWNMKTYNYTHTCNGYNLLAFLSSKNIDLTYLWKKNKLGMHGKARVDHQLIPIFIIKFKIETKIHVSCNWENWIKIIVCKTIAFKSWNKTNTNSMEAFLSHFKLYHTFNPVFVFTKIIPFAWNTIGQNSMW